MIVTIHQPDFLPWLGFFDRWRRADLLVLLDDAQFLRRGWHHRDRIKTADGPAWITVPVAKKGRFDQRIGEVAIDNQTCWRRKHLGLIRASYAKAPVFAPVFAELETIYNRDHERLVDLNRALIDWAAAALDIATPVVLASSLPSQQGRTARLVELCQAHGASTYLSGTGARAYLDETLFERAGIRIHWQAFDHPVYPQLHGPFEPGLSVLDYLMMGGGRDG